jgi:flagellar biosynthesis/type III secretory pathway protein FliH
MGTAMSGLLKPGPGTRVEPLFPGSLLLSASREQLGAREQQARQRLDDATREASAILDAARARALAIEHDARQQGHEAGVRRMGELCHQTAQQLAAMHAELRQRLLGAAMELARGILHRELQADPAAFVPVVEDVVRRCALCTRVTIVLHPEQASIVEAAHARLAAAAPLAGRLEVRANAASEPWSVVVETDQGVYVGGIEASLGAVSAGVHRATHAGGGGGAGAEGASG